MTLSVKDRANAYASIATSGRFAAIAWGATTRESVTDVYLAWSRDGGRTFAAPARVNTAEGEANFSGEQPPRIGLLPRARPGTGHRRDVDGKRARWHAAVVGTVGDWRDHVHDGDRCSG